MARSRLRVQFTALRARKLPFTSAKVVAGLTAYTEAWADHAIERLKVYPPEPAGSTYERTNTLKNAWKKRRAPSTDAIRIIIENNARDPRSRFYATYVQGARQTDIMSGIGWENVADVARRTDFVIGAQAVIVKELVQ